MYASAYAHSMCGWVVVKIENATKRSLRHNRLHIPKMQAKYSKPRFVLAKSTKTNTIYPNRMANIDGAPCVHLL